MEAEIFATVEHQLEMSLEPNRLATFKAWKFGVEAKCSAKKLAEAGFYFTGTKEEPDAVQCFLCDKALDGWDENDDPWQEHLSHSSSCAFAQMHTPEEDLTVDQLTTFHKESIRKHANAAAAKIAEFYKSKCNKKHTQLKKSVNSLKKL